SSAYSCAIRRSSPAAGGSTTRTRAGPGGATPEASTTPRTARRFARWRRCWNGSAHRGNSVRDRLDYLRLLADRLCQEYFPSRMRHRGHQAGKIVFHVAARPEKQRNDADRADDLGDERGGGFFQRVPVLPQAEAD